MAQPTSKNRNQRRYDISDEQELCVTAHVKIKVRRSLVNSLAPNKSRGA